MASRFWARFCSSATVSSPCAKESLEPDFKSAAEDGKVVESKVILPVVRPGLPASLASTSSPTSVETADGSSPLGGASSPVRAQCSFSPGVREVLDEAERLCDAEATPFAAERLIMQLLDRLEAEGSADIASSVRASGQYSRLIRDLTKANLLLKKLLDDDGWTPQKRSDCIHVWTRPEPGSDLVTVRLAGTVPGPYEIFAAIGKELKCVKDWMPGVKTSYVINERTDFEQVGYYVWKFPFLQAREFLVDEESYIHDDAAYCIVNRNPPVPRPGLQLPPKQAAVVRASISQMCTFSMPIGSGPNGEPVNFVVSVLNVDLKMPLPSWLLNSLSVNLGYKSIVEMRANVKKAISTSHPLYICVHSPQRKDYYERMRKLEKTRREQPLSVFQELLETGWIKDVAERRALFQRSTGVLVPLPT